MLLNRSRGELGGKPFAQHCSCPACFRCSVGLTVAASLGTILVCESCLLAQWLVSHRTRQQGGSVEPPWSFAYQASLARSLNMFQSDFKFVAQYFRAKRLNNTYVPTEEEIKHADELLKMFTALTGDKLFERAYNKVILEKKGGITMCDIVKGFYNGGKEDLIRQMLESKLVTEQQIADLLKISVEEVKKNCS